MAIPIDAAFVCLFVVVAVCLNCVPLEQHSVSVLGPQLELFLCVLWSCPVPATDFRSNDRIGPFRFTATHSRRTKQNKTRDDREMPAKLVRFVDLEGDKTLLLLSCRSSKACFQLSSSSESEFGIEISISHKTKSAQNPQKH
jgi:hypothetical protein